MGTSDAAASTDDQAARPGPAGEARPPRTPLVTPPAATALLLSAALGLFVVVLLRHAWMCDDAFITLRTVRNLVAGDGLRWNLIERVQVYTHPLWMLLLSAAYAFRPDPYRVTMAVSIALSVATVWLVAFRLARELRAALLAVAVLVSSKSFMDFCTSGLENPLVHLLYAAFWMEVTGSAWRRPPSVPETAPPEARLTRLALLAALLGTCRLDALLLVSPALLAQAVRDRADRRALWRGLAGLAPLFAWELFSLVYYGFLFPNTAYAKLAVGIPAGALAAQGFGYYVSQLSHDPISLLIIPLGVAAPFLARQRRLYAAAAGLILHGAYVVAIGGDFMAGRFFSTPLLGATILLARCLPALLGAAVIPVHLPAAAVAAVAFVITPRPTLSANADYSNALPPAQGDWDARGIADERAYYYPGSGLLRVAGDREVPMDEWPAKGRAFRPNQAVVWGRVGASGFYAPPGAILVDGLGLTDPLIARLPIADPTSWRIGHFVRQIPEGYLASLESGQNLIKDPRIAELYRRLRVVTSGPLWRWERWKEIVRLNLAGSRL
jgi:arabinofuranosyltransferase